MLLWSATAALLMSKLLNIASVVSSASAAPSSFASSSSWRVLVVLFRTLRRKPALCDSSMNSMARLMTLSTCSMDSSMLPTSFALSSSLSARRTLFAITRHCCWWTFAPLAALYRFFASWPSIPNPPITPMISSSPTVPPNRDTNPPTCSPVFSSSIAFSTAVSNFS